MKNYLMRGPYLLSSRFYQYQQDLCGRKLSIVLKINELKLFLLIFIIFKHLPAGAPPIFMPFIEKINFKFIISFYTLLLVLT